jgi:Na+-translocating ferredoxin:NAD+ oxidoreductase RnfC subunit
MQDPIADHGVVGAGGAGFPAAAKLAARVDTVIVNAAECEPLLHKDKELLIHFWAEIRRGIESAMERTGASNAVLGIKGKHSDLIEKLKPQLPSNMKLWPLRDTYPSGDEFVLVFDVTGQVIPPGGLPLHVGVVVSNVETLLNIGVHRPVTRKYLSVAGAVRNPATLCVPVGTPFEDLIEAVGGTTVPDFRVLVGGVMMGRLAASLQEPVTKTTGGLIVLPAQHTLVKRYALTRPQVERKARAACDQCSFCTELCPRYLLGHPIEPHKAMRHVGFGGSGTRPASEGLYCCECNLCSLFACPEDLDPKEICASNKAGMKRETLAISPRPHPLINSRRVPTRRLFHRLGLSGFRDEAPLIDGVLRPRLVFLPLQQHIGAACVPTVRKGERVPEGAVIASPPPKALGANIHASIQGTVTDVTPAGIRIEA